MFLWNSYSILHPGDLLCANDRPVLTVLNFVDHFAVILTHVLKEQLNGPLSKTQSRQSTIYFSLFICLIFPPST